MGLFKPAENTMAFLKMGVMGEAGSGKTHTSTLVAVGLVKYLRERGIAGSDRPAMMLDTENGSSWIKPIFDEAGIPLMVAKTRAFRDLVPAVLEAKTTASVLLIDSITHFWEELKSSYLAKKSARFNRVVDLEFQDWAWIKQQWSGFSDAFVTSPLHIVMSGRLGWEYEHTKDERGKKQIEKSAVKMQAEKGLGYEPNILVWMERDMDLQTKVVSRTATVLKDRSRRLDGKEFPNPTFATFLPHIEFMALGGRHEAADTARTSTDIMPDDDAGRSDIKGIRRQIVLDEIQALMVEHYPSQSADDKKAKAALLEKHFSTKSWTEVEKLMPAVDIQANYDAMHRALTGKPSRYGIPDALQNETPIEADSIPALDVEPQPAARAPPADKPRVRVKAGAAPSADNPTLADVDGYIVKLEEDISLCMSVEDLREVADANADLIARLPKMERLKAAKMIAEAAT